MANIDLNLDLDGNDLFEDSEDFMIELTDDIEQAGIIGGYNVTPDLVPPPCGNTPIIPPDC